MPAGVPADHAGSTANSEIGKNNSGNSGDRTRSAAGADCGFASVKVHSLITAFAYPVDCLGLPGYADAC